MKFGKATAGALFGVPGLLLAFLLCSGTAISASGKEPGNDGRPVVRITAPANNSTYSWNSLVNYSIVVSYLGKSTQYQEIPSTQVLLKTTYVPDLSKMEGERIQAAARPPAGLLDITRSSCLGCHSFKGKLMGPSFAAIGQRFPASQATINTLSQHIREGSTGVWGQASMPPQAQLTDSQLHAIVLWIMKDAANPRVNYYAGTEGAFRMDAPAAANPKGGMILTASYTAPISPSGHEQAPRGEDTVIVHGK